MSVATTDVSRRSPPSGATLATGGCFTAIITPFTPDASAIDFARLEEQIKLQAAGGVTGIVVAGTTGESPTLTDAEWRTLLDRAIAIARPLGLLIIAGTGSNSTAHAVELHKVAAGLGADASLSVNPYYNKPTQEGLSRHFEAVANAAALPVMLYNIPGRTGVALSIDTITRLAEHSNIHAIKDATGGLDMASEVTSVLPRLKVYSGDDPLTLPMMAVGAIGVVSVVSNLVPGHVSVLCRAMNTGGASNAGGPGGHAEALRLHREIWRLTRSLFIETKPIPVKAAMALRGLDSGSLRLPMCAPGSDTVARLRTELRRLELI